MTHQKAHLDSSNLKSTVRPASSEPPSRPLTVEREGLDKDNAATDEPNILDQRLDARPFSTGRKTENHLPHDDENTERLVEMGVDEAARDEKAIASRTSTKSEG